MNHKFYGGVHPAEHKEATERKPVVPLEEAPAQVVIPMSMHVGAPCKPIVAVGDEVTVGQKIGEIAGLGAPIHASVSGKVVAVEPRPHPGGDVMMSVVIENDFKDTPHPSIVHRDNVDALTSQEIIDIVKEAGITGMGGAGFPTHVKLSGAVGKADTIILNGAECEPYITADHRLMLERGEAVIGGARFIMKALGLKEATIGIEGNKLDAVEHLKSLLPNGDTSIHVETLKTRYPQGAEKQLIQRVTGREVPPGGLPADVGCTVFNVATAAAIYDAVTEGKPLTHRNVTITGGAIERPMNVNAPIGTPVEHLIKMAGGFKTQPQRLLMGGPMMGNPQYDLTAPMFKGTNCILALTDAEAAIQDTEQTCLRCGRCVNACPMHLMPLYMHMYAEKRAWHELEGYNIMDCMECGSCNYICPARIHLVQSFRMAKFEIRGLAAKQKAKEGKA
ncbi:MAG: electron transport complex subunit RsxC [Clostridiales bacterium]|uniref:Ion-translocating oxidoreductase complex subunit C n=1 Tax=Intestinimonas massiliensis (ex Afouda et al. 2020) TaxID=1673721 RepID=A0AAW5JVM1_9FIRM|nr:electron transport complex subunit RsxC [Intestinimonas massiliensis (ex Afouda et al. 2020)]MDU1325987.1 electron transport complex subunit RsxC [Clostridiales bacterium]CUQ60501.1 electron transport complex protein%2C subunit C [Flavonifractor plautii]SCJ42247.1 Nitrogen fixation protein rnfC [uncultured Flavonifractor sp.]MCG4528241.1 electron transport complex subunit RsxC [Intestinimonas massiliensis (ex Afouda et al. 2020)]MCQ4771260.1 electron transport complex subunit RsxC [Intestin